MHVGSREECVNPAAKSISDACVWLVYYYISHLSMCHDMQLCSQAATSFTLPGYAYRLVQKKTESSFFILSLHHLLFSIGEVRASRASNVPSPHAPLFDTYWPGHSPTNPKTTNATLYVAVHFPNARGQIIFFSLSLPDVHLERPG